MFDDIRNRLWERRCRRENEDIAKLGAIILLTEPEAPIFPLDLSRVAGLATGRTYDLLARMRGWGWFEFEAVAVPVSRRRRYFYTLNECGRRNLERLEALP